MALPLVIVLASGGDAWAGKSALSWQRLSVMPEGVFNAKATVSGRKVVVAGGVTQAGITSQSVQVFDLDQEKWVASIPLIDSRNKHAQLTLRDGRVLIAAGQTGGVGSGWKALASCELIDLSKGKSVETAPLVHPAAEPTAHLLPDGRAMVIGHERASIFDPAAGQWIFHIKLRRKRQAHASVLLPGWKVLVIGGMHESSLELIDIRRGISRQLAAKLPFALDDTRAALTEDGRVWILGGQDTHRGDTTDRTWLVQIGKGKSTLSEGPKLGIAQGIADHCVIELGSWLVIAGGESQRDGADVELNGAWLANRRTLQVVAVSPMRMAHDDAAAVADGSSAIVFGGMSMQRILGRKEVIPLAVPMVERLRIGAADAR